MEKAALPLDERVQRGDPAAFVLLYEQSIAHLQARALAIGCDYHQAEDVAHEAIEQALRTHTRFDPKRGDTRHPILRHL